ncbi:MAG: hypothetical protein H8D95_01355 [Candidatus Endolissoclinum sp.]|nr:hypothetical protein [Candidatus Endolissoclinum sp.]
MIKETTILKGIDKTYDSVDAFFTENGLDDWRANELKMFTDAGFDLTDSSRHMVQLSEDGTNNVIITVAYANQAEKDAILASASGTEPSGLEIILDSDDHLF